MPRAHAAALLLALLAASPAAGEEAAAATLEYRILAHEPNFTPFGEGLLGEPFRDELPHAVTALRLLLDRPDAAAVLRELAADEQAPLGGRLYALAGLRCVDPATFARLAAPWRERDDAVWLHVFHDEPHRLCARVTALDDPAPDGQAARLSEWPRTAPPRCAPREAAALLDSPRSRLRRRARELLVAHGRAAGAVLAERVARGGTLARMEALRACQALGARAVDAVPAIERALYAPEPEVVSAALAALRAIGPWACEAAPAVWALLARAGTSARLLVEGSDTLWEVLPGWDFTPPRALPAFVATCEGCEHERGGPERHHFLRSLPGAALPTLFEALREGDRDLRGDAKLVLWGGGGAAAFAPACQLLHDADPELRLAALVVLDGIVDDVPELREAVLAATAPLAESDPDRDVRDYARDLRAARAAPASD